MNVRQPRFGLDWSVNLVHRVTREPPFYLLNDRFDSNSEFARSRDWKKEMYRKWSFRGSLNFWPVKNVARWKKLLSEKVFWKMELSTPVPATNSRWFSIVSALEGTRYYVNAQKSRERRRETEKTAFDGTQVTVGKSWKNLLFFVRTGMGAGGRASAISAFKCTLAA